MFYSIHVIFCHRVELAASDRYDRSLPTLPPAISRSSIHRFRNRQICYIYHHIPFPHRCTAATGPAAADQSATTAPGRCSAACCLAACLAHRPPPSAHPSPPLHAAWCAFYNKPHWPSPASWARLCRGARRAARCSRERVLHHRTGPRLAARRRRRRQCSPRCKRQLRQQCLQRWQRPGKLAGGG